MMGHWGSGIATLIPFVLGAMLVAILTLLDIATAVGMWTPFAGALERGRTEQSDRLPNRHSLRQ
jgi:hypothetical protein